MWKEFYALTQTTEWEKDGGLIIERVVGLETPQNTFSNLTIDLHVVPGANNSRQKWRLQCENVLSHFLCFEWCEEIELLDQHILLWPHQQPGGRLWISGRADDVAATVGGLYQAHLDLCGEWFAFEKFLNPQARLNFLLASSGGLLASGPQNVLEAYSQVLAAHGVASSATEWAHRLVPDVHLVLMGRSFCVCEKAELRRVSGAVVIE